MFVALRGFLIYNFYQNLEKFKHKKAIIYKSILKFKKDKSWKQMLQNLLIFVALT